MMDKLNAAASTPDLTPMPSINPSMLYRVDVYHDPGAGRIEIHVPVDVEGRYDETRFPKFFSPLTINVDGQVLNVIVEIKLARTLAEAIAKWPDEMATAARSVVEQVRSNRMREILLSPSGPIRPS